MLLLMIVGLYTSRVVLLAIGISDYGIYNVVGGFVSMIAYVNTVFVAATQRFLSYSLGENDKDKLKKMFCTSLTVHLVLASVIFIIAETLGLWVVNTQLVIEPARWRKRSIPTHSGWLYPLTFDAEKGLKEA